LFAYVPGAIATDAVVYMLIYTAAPIDKIKSQKHLLDLIIVCGNFKASMSIILAFSGSGYLATKNKNCLARNYWAAKKIDNASLELNKRLVSVR
jgi:hypothetical protein